MPKRKDKDPVLLLLDSVISDEEYDLDYRLQCALLKALYTETISVEAFLLKAAPILAEMRIIIDPRGMGL